jgi:capsular polysaccharide biosynthesis protein
VARLRDIMLGASNGSGQPGPAEPVREAPESVELPPASSSSEEPPSVPWRGEDEDTRLTVSSAVRNNWLVFLLPIVFLVSAAVVAGMLRSPTYTAETRLAVGGLDASSPASNSDFAAAASSLAQTYGRSIQGDAVVSAVARKTGSSPEAVRAHISAFTVPSTPLFSVTATAGSPGTAIALANLASRSLSAAADDATRDLASPLLEQYRKAELASQRIEREVRFLQATGQGEELVAAKAKLAIAETRAASAREAFVAGEQRQQALAVPIQIIERANSASSDRFSVLQLWIFIALALGLIVGTALALFRESRYLRFIST